MEVRAKGLNDALKKTAHLILKEGVKRKTRGFNCIEIPEPVIITIDDPTDRYIFNVERKWNKFLGAAESLWLMSGINVMSEVGAVVKNLYTFSDDGKFMRAGYGPRIRCFTGLGDDYENKDILTPLEGQKYFKKQTVTDQLKYVVETLKKDNNSRQAVITIHDPAKDCFNEDGSLKTTKDQPCTRLLQFMIVDGKLNCTTYMRSNDFLWGMSAVNIFNFTIFQEVIAGLVGVEVGKYYHVVNNLHYYENFEDRVQAIADSEEYAEYESFKYKFPKGWTFKQFDKQIQQAYSEFRLMVDSQNPYHKLTSVGIPLFDDLLKTLAVKFDKYTDEEPFENNNLKKLFKYE